MAQAVCVTTGDGSKVLIKVLSVVEYLNALKTEKGDGGTAASFRSIRAAVRTAIAVIDGKPIAYGEIRSLSDRFPRSADRNALMRAFGEAHGPTADAVGEAVASAVFDSGSNTWTVTPYSGHLVAASFPPTLRVSEPTDATMDQVLEAMEARARSGTASEFVGYQTCSGLFVGEGLDASTLPVWAVVYLGQLWARLFISAEASDTGPLELVEV